MGLRNDSVALQICFGFIYESYLVSKQNKNLDLPVAVCSCNPGCTQQGRLSSSRRRDCKGVFKNIQISTLFFLFHLVCPLVSPSISAAFGPVGLNSGISLKMDGWTFNVFS